MGLETIPIILAVTWGFLCGLFVSLSIIKHLITAFRRRYVNDLRRAKTVNIDVDAQCIDGKQLLCRVTINGRKVLMLYVSSDTPLHYSTMGENGVLPVEIHDSPTTIQ